MLVLGVINGGLGAQLAEEDNMFIIPYSVIAAVLYVTWLVVVVLKNRKGEQAEKPTLVHSGQGTLHTT
jgi:hypothetical protein